MMMNDNAAKNTSTTRKEGNMMTNNSNTKRIKVTAKPKVYPGGLLLIKGSIATMLTDMDDELANKVAAIGKEYDDATQVEGCWHNKPTRNLPAIVLECSDDLAHYIHGNSKYLAGYIAEDRHVTNPYDKRALIITWDKEHPKRALACGLSVRQKLSDFLNEMSFETIGTDRDEDRSWEYTLTDMICQLSDEYREQGFRETPTLDRDKVSSELYRHFRYPEFHKG